MFATTILGYTLSTMWLIIWSVIILVVWIALAFWPASIAQSKGRSFWLFFLLSIFFWWIMLFVAIFMKDESSPTQTTTHTEE
ncbi:MAG: hypothetical protein NTV39_00375 [Candidatus Saccharibacteria bacterium]|nr:hypothetical protein [Candidatus Saccharibacteria bacterium]